MRVLFVTPYFPPEVGAAQTRIYELATRLAKMGHQVTVLTTFPNYPTGIVPRQWRGKLIWRGDEQGITIRRIWSYAAPNRGFVRRIISHTSFAVTASIAVLLLRSADVTVIESPPLFDGIVGVLAGFKGSPYVFTVSDLWLQTAIEMRVLKNQLLIWASMQMEQLFYRRSAAILALTEGIRRRIIADRVDSLKVILFRNSVDCDFFQPRTESSQIRNEIGVRETDFIALYAGTLGLAQNLGTVLQAAELLQNQGQQDVRFVFAGAGADGEDLNQRAREWRLNNVSFIDPLPKARMPELINASDCVLVPLRNLEIFRGALPTKMFEGMACAKPIVLGIAGEAEELISTAEAGYCVPPDTPSAICNAILALKANREEARRMGKNGRDYIMREFSREARAQQLARTLEAVVAPKTKCNGQ